MFDKAYTYTVYIGRIFITVQPSSGQLIIIYNPPSHKLRSMICIQNNHFVLSKSFAKKPAAAMSVQTTLSPILVPLFTTLNFPVVGSNARFCRVFFPSATCCKWPWTSLLLDMIFSPICNSFIQLAFDLGSLGWDLDVLIAGLCRMYL